MNNQVLFSVLVANYNNGNYLEEAINSVFSQTYSNWEIIIIDDCSTDISRSVYEKYSSENRIKIFYNSENKGCGYTKRRCIEEANGEICGFLDPDDKLALNAIEIMVDLHQDEQAVSLICSNTYICKEDLSVDYIFNKGENGTIDYNDPYFFNIGGYIGHFATFKKSFYQQTEGIDAFLIRAVDQDLYLKLCEVGQVHVIPDPLYYYRIHDKGISTISNVDKASYWHWAVISDAARRRNVNPENLFIYHFVSRHQYNILLTKYDRLKKYEKLNNLISKIRNIFRN